MASVSRYCCCNDPCVDCSNDGANCTFCNDTDELTYTVVTSGVTMCGCLTSIGGRTYTWIHATALNGTHTITQTGGSACIWEVTYTNAVREDQYVNTDCTGGVAASSNFDATFRMTASGGSSFSFEIELVNAFRNSIFIDTQSSVGASICCEIPLFTNDNTAGNCDTNGPPLGAVRVGYGGTATVTC